MGKIRKVTRRWGGSSIISPCIPRSRFPSCGSLKMLTIIARVYVMMIRLKPADLKEEEAWHMTLKEETGDETSNPSSSQIKESADRHFSLSLSLFVGDHQGLPSSSCSVMRIRQCLIQTLFPAPSSTSGCQSSHFLFLRFFPALIPTFSSSLMMLIILLLLMIVTKILRGQREEFWTSYGISSASWSEHKVSALKAVRNDTRLMKAERNLFCSSGHSLAPERWLEHDDEDDDDHRCRLAGLLAIVKQSASYRHVHHSYEAESLIKRETRNGFRWSDQKRFKDWWK